jgi:tRNA(adenine34) deaminase
MKASIFSDEYFMQKALEEARLAQEEGEVPVGAVIVSENQIIGKGHNQVEKLNDISAHAEIIAISAASNYLGAKYLQNCRIYVSLEPCAMCATAINNAQLDSLIYGASDSKRGYTQFKPALIHPKVNVVKDILKDKCSEILIDFFAEKREANEHK